MWAQTEDSLERPLILRIRNSKRALLQALRGRSCSDQVIYPSNGTQVSNISLLTSQPPRPPSPSPSGSGFFICEFRVCMPVKKSHWKRLSVIFRIFLQRKTHSRACVNLENSSESSIDIKVKTSGKPQKNKSKKSKRNLKARVYRGEISKFLDKQYQESSLFLLPSKKIRIFLH